MALDRANAIIEARYGPQQQAIQRRIDQANQMTGVRNQAITQQGDLARGYVGDAYNILDQSLGQNKTNALQALETAGNQIGQGYRDAQVVGEQLRTRSRDALAELAQRMGAGQYAMPVLGGLEETVNQLIQANANRDATVTGNLRNWGAQAGDVYNRQIGMGQQMRADALSRLESDLIRAMQESNLAGAEEVTDLGDLLSEMLGKRSADLAQTVNELSAQDFDQSYKQAQLDMAAAELNARMADSAADRDLRAAAMADEQARWAAEFGREGQMTDKEKLALQLEAWGMQQSQTDRDRNYGLEVSKLRQAGQPSAIEKFQALQSARLPLYDDEGNQIGLGGVDPTAMQYFYESGILPRPRSSGGGSRFGGGGRSAWSRRGLGGGLTAPSYTPGSLESLRAAHAGLRR